MDTNAAPGSGHVPSTQPDRRTLIWPEYGGIIPAKNGVSVFMKQKFKQQICPGGYSWRWEVQYDTQIRDLWHKQCADVYRRTLHGWRTSGNVPRTIDPAIWVTYLTHYEGEKWQNLSKTYGKNKHSEPAGPGTGITTHVAGSRPYAVHTANLREELQRDPNSYELHLQTHRRPNGTFVDRKSRQISEEVDRRISEQFPLRHSGDAQHYPSVEDVNRIYLDVVGGVSHRRIYGIGSTAQTIYPDEMTPRPRGPTHMKSILAAQNDALQAVREVAHAARQKAQAVIQKTQQLQAEHEVMQTRLNKMERMMAKFVSAIQKKQKLAGDTHAQPSRITLHIQEPTHQQDQDDDDETREPSDWSQFIR